MKLNAKQLRHIINEVAGDHNSRIQQTVNDMQRALTMLLDDLPDEGLNSDLYVALDDLDQALRAVKDVARRKDVR